MRPAATWVPPWGQCQLSLSARWISVLGLRRTSPPPMTRTFLFLTCQARIREPPPSTSGYWWSWCSMVVVWCV
jgi:hypothetical protein